MIDTVFIVGPTASGKSALALRLAEVLDAEIICADSQTIRRELDLGTAKPSKEEQARVRHHLLDVIGPYDSYSAAQFKADAEAALHDIHQRGNVALVVGGTGLYIDALFYDYGFSGVPADERVRRELSGNPRHVASHAKPLQHPPRPASSIIGLDPGRETILAHIHARIASNFEHGFMHEVERVVTKYGPPPATIDAIAYRYAVELLEGTATEAETKEHIFIAERQFAKRQMTWFKRNPHIKWFSAADEAYDFVCKTLKS